ncbi:MAG: DMT family transporter [Actinobacteria bacterium]|nr:DMT family transporter [Actinomycetota bacterium]MDA2984761.1 DMT family transporter [Actinomycetota bacterium]
MLRNLRGEIFLLLGAAAFAFNGVISKIVLLDGLSAWRLTQIRSTGAFLILLTYFLIFKPRELPAKKGELKWLIAFGIVGVFLVQALYFIAIERIYLGTALLIEFTAPIWILLFMRFVLKKQVDPLLWIAVTFSISGLMIVTQVWQGLVLDGIGLIAAFLDSIALAGYFLIAEKLGKTKSSATMTVWGFGIGSFFMALVMPIWSFPFEYLNTEMNLLGIFAGYTLPGWVLILWIILMGTIAPYLLVIGGLKILSASTASVIGIMEPVLGSLFAWWWLNEALNNVQLSGAIVVIIGIYLANRAKDRSPRV